MYDCVGLKFEKIKDCEMCKIKNSCKRTMQEIKRKKKIRK